MVSEGGFARGSLWLVGTPFRTPPRELTRCCTGLLNYLLSQNPMPQSLLWETRGLNLGTRQHQAPGRRVSALGRRVLRRRNLGDLTD